jgi:hypothetical protein
MAHSMRLARAANIVQMADVVRAACAHHGRMPNHHHQSRRCPLLAAAGIAALALPVVAALPGPPAGAETMAPPGSPPAIAASGQWTDADPLSVVSAQPAGAGELVTATGSSLWSGTLSGTTHFVVRALIDPSGAAHGTIDETFDGGVQGLGSGEIRFAESFSQQPSGDLHIAAVAVSSGDGLVDAGGALAFSGATDASGVGGGTYRGVIIERP